MDPGVREAAINAQLADMQRRTAQPEQPQVSVVSGPSKPDFRKQPPEPDPPKPQPVYNQPPPATAEEVVAAMPASMKPPEGANVHTDGIAPFVTQGVPKPPPATPPHKSEPDPEPEQESDEAGGGAVVRHCPRCMWNLSYSFDADPTEVDRAAFVATILGARFEKTYEAMGGGIQITFRSLSADEVDLVFRQMRIDQLNGEVITEPDYFGRMNTYRMACMVKQIANRNGTIVADLPPIFDIPYDEPEFGSPKQTRLIPLLDYFNKEVCPTESLRRVVAQQHRAFQRLLEALEAQTAEPGFWKEID
jgi:hypothetical protein